jgi:hypothetical protein
MNTLTAIAGTIGAIVVLANILPTSHTSSASKPITTYASTRLTATEKTWMDGFNARVITPIVKDTDTNSCNHIRDERDINACISALDNLASTIDTSVVWLNGNSHQAPGCISPEISALRSVLVTMMNATRDAVSAYQQRNMRKLESSTTNFTQGTKDFGTVTSNLKASMKTC